MCEAHDPIMFDDKEWAWVRTFESIAHSRGKRDIIADLYTTGDESLVSLSGCWEAEMDEWPDGMRINPIITGADAVRLTAFLDDKDLLPIRTVLQSYWIHDDDWTDGVFE
jgi:hypothetical protein